MYVYISLTLCYLRLTRTEVFNPQCKYWFIFVLQGTSFYECKKGGIIQKGVSLLKIKHIRNIDLIKHEASGLLVYEDFYREVGQH